MKKILLFLALGFTVINYAQCISGNASLPFGTTATYTSTATAQCTSCYDWDINGNSTSSDNSTVGNIKIVGSDIGQSVSIQGLAAGPFSIHLTYFDETGCHECDFSGNVTCNFSVAISNTVIFGTNSLTFQAVTTPSLSSGVTYLWTATYQNGSTANFTSTTSNQATFTSSSSNPIISVAVNATYQGCTSSAIKTNIPCNINASIGYMKVGDGTTNAYILSASPHNSAYTYTWVITYANGTTVTLTGWQVTPLACNDKSPIASVTLTITSALCSSTVTRTDLPNLCGTSRMSINIKNPLKNLLDIEFETNQFYKGVIYDLNGTRILDFNSSNLEQDISFMKKGLYLIKIYDAQDKELISKKIIKE